LIYGGISGSTDLGFVAQILKPKKTDAAGFGAIRASNMLTHAADEFVCIDDLVAMAKESVHTVAF